VPSYENIYKKKLDSGSTLTRITPDNSGKLSIYPNPSHESFMIQYSGSGNLVDCTISFFNSAGVEQKLKIKKFQETFQVAWGNQASGIYYYKLTNSSNGQYFSGIIIKQ
jgi:hypothetical protein